MEAVAIVPKAKLLYRIREVAQELSVSRATVRALITLNYLPAIRIGRLALIHRDDLETFAKIGMHSIWGETPWPTEGKL